MGTTTTDQTRSPEVLRAEIVDRIVAFRASVPGLHALSERVLDIMRTVPRHLFVPDADLLQAYRLRAFKQ